MYYLYCYCVDFILYTTSMTQPKMIMKTSTRISLWFTVLVGILMLFFIVLLNIGFFASWHNNRRNGIMRGQWGVSVVTLHQPVIQQTSSWEIQISWQLVGKHLPMINIKRDFVFTEDEFPGVEGMSNLWYSADIYKIDNNRFLLRKAADNIVITDVTQSVNRQNELLMVSSVLWICFMVLTYILSRFFVSRSLRDLNTLAKSVRDVSVETLGRKHVIEHLPIDDEINVVAWSIDSMQQTISDQISSMKDFVSHVSHEFKTPLMVLQSTSDIAEKSGDMTGVIPQYKKIVWQMSWILDTLTLLARSQSEISLQAEKVDIHNLVGEIVDGMNGKYSDKRITATIENKHPVVIHTHKSSATIILKNIIENAYKYTPVGWEVDIVVNSDGVAVKDSGVWISQQDIKNIREPFWQVDKNREDGVWLGLHIVKRLSALLEWNIQVDSVIWEGTAINVVRKK